MTSAQSTTKPLAAALILDLLHANPYYVLELKLLLEKVGFYHDITGSQIDALYDNQQIKRIIHPRDHPETSLRDQAYVFAGNSEPQIQHKSSALSAFLDYHSDNALSGYFAQAIVFIATARTATLTPNCHVLQPEIMWVDGYRYKMDIPVLIGSEAHNIEVKNNLPQIAPTSSQIQEFSQTGRDQLPSDLVCRIATVGTKRETMRKNGLVVELGKLILMDTNDSRARECKNSLKLLNIEAHVQWLPRIVRDSRSYDGREFIAALRSERLSLEDVASLSGQVPPLVQSKINALIRLMSINQRFRQAYNYPEGKRAKIMINALLIQYAYKIIVDNAPTHFDIDDLFRQAGSKIRGNLLHWLRRDQASCEAQFKEEWDNLKHIHFVDKRANSVWVDDASQPEMWLHIESQSAQELAKKVLM